MTDTAFGTSPAANQDAGQLRVTYIADINKARLVTVAFKTAANDNEVIADDVDVIFCADGTYSLLLPPTPTASTQFLFVRQTAGAGVITIDRNGSNINAVAANLTLSTTLGDRERLLWSTDVPMGWWQ